MVIAVLHAETRNVFSGRQQRTLGVAVIVCVCLLQYDPQATGVIDYQALMQQLLHSDYYALYLGSVDNTQNTLDATATFSMITNLKSQFAAQSRKLHQVRLCPWAVQLRIACW